MDALYEFYIHINHYDSAMALFGRLSDTAHVQISLIHIYDLFGSGKPKKN